MKRPKGEVTIRLIAKSSSVTEQTLTNSSKFLIRVLEKEDIKSFRRLDPLILILNVKQQKYYDSIVNYNKRGLIIVKSRR